MASGELDHIIEILGSLSPKEMLRLRREIDSKLAKAAHPAAGPPLGSLGAMRDAADELDAIVEQVMRNRQERW